jgi:predicted pyridoxine 5'-phosphate oxidase superfamily flavin-nucleotide-binding protein
MIFPEINDKLTAFIEAQHMFFVATAPTEGGHVNLSPKGLKALRILGPTTVAYLDFTGSGVETIAHLRENGRIVLMLCAFDGPPKTVRLHGRGDVIEPQDAEFPALIKHFDNTDPGVRSIIRVQLTRISDSCGYSTPLYRFEKQRSQLADWAEHKGERGLLEYQCEANVTSIDGLPGLRWPVSEEK